MQTITSGFLSLNTRDFIKGIVVAMISAAFAVVAQSVQQGHFTFDFTAIWHTSVAAGIAYLGKNFFTPAQAVKPIG